MKSEPEKSLEEAVGDAMNQGLSSLFIFAEEMRENGRREHKEEEGDVMVRECEMGECLHFLHVDTDTPFPFPTPFSSMFSAKKKAPCHFRR